MTDKNLTEIVFVIDRSGSMGHPASKTRDAIGGFNQFLADQQKEEGECRITYIQFDHEYEVVHEALDIQRMKPLDNTTYVPRGATALLYAVGRTIDMVGKRLARTPDKDRPGNVTVVILTDGEENSSHNFGEFNTKEEVSAMIEHQIEKYDWSFIYLGANVDAFAEAAGMGLHASHANVFVANYVASAPETATKGVSNLLSGSRRRMARGMSKAYSNKDKGETYAIIGDESNTMNKVGGSSGTDSESS